jgi:sporulation protein YhbH
VRKIDPDTNRFRKIVRGKIRENLKQYVSQGELLARQGKKVVSVPLPQIDIPNFRFGDSQQGGVGMGDGEVGEPIGEEKGPPGAEAGDQAGEHVIEVEVSLEELAEILGEELELPRIEPRGTESVKVEKDRYTGINRNGPESLRHFRRTFKAALRRQIASGSYDPKKPKVIPVREDRRYRSWNTKQVPQSNAVIIYMMDVSGSMGNEQKDIVRIESFWLDTWLQSQYENIETRYIIHDAQAKLVDAHTFFHVRESGGTKISSAYNLAKELIQKEFSPLEWNIYPFHFSDGDNWGGDDTAQCIRLLQEDLIPASNVFCYGQVKSAYGSGQFIKDLREGVGQDEKVLVSEINSRDEILPSIKTFLGKGC